MILTESVEMKITNRNISYYRTKNYKCIKGDLIDIKVKDLPKNSQKYIKTICDCCGIEKNLKIQAYWINYNNHGFYSCHKCSYLKNKITCVKKYGVDNPMKVYKFKECAIETCINKYGVQNYSQTDEFKIKCKKTCYENYGAEHPLQSNVNMSKFKKTCLKKYGVEFPMMDKEIHDKSKKTCHENYGVEYPTMCVDIKNKIRERKIEMCIQSKNINEYSKYRNKITHLTSKAKEKLFKEWDGYDYYDNEYIMDNFNNNCYSSNYPTIDHKISVLYGYLNGITPEEISDIENLCITKRVINSRKGGKCEMNFLKKC